MVVVGLRYRTEAQIYPSDEVVTSPMLKSARVMSEACQVDSGEKTQHLIHMKWVASTQL